MPLEVITKIDAMSEAGEPIPATDITLTLLYVTYGFSTFPLIRVEVPGADPSYIRLDQLQQAVVALQIQTSNPT